LQSKDIEDIRFFCINRIPKELINKKYNLSIASIRDILHGRTWKHLNLPKLKVQDPFKITIKDIENIKKLRGMPSRKIKEILNFSRITIVKVLNGEYDNYYNILKTYFENEQNLERTKN